MRKGGMEAGLFLGICNWGGGIDNCFGGVDMLK